MAETLVTLKGKQIAFYQLCSVIGALKLEIRGLKHSRGSVYVVAKKRYGLKGNKERVLAQLETLKEKLIEDRGE
jgi:hypothetical protein